MPKQLPLNLSLEANYGRDDFILSAANALAMETLDGFPNWAAQIMILKGPNGSGKTHMAHIWAETSKAHYMAGSDFDAKSAETLHGKNFILDGFGENPFDEVALFHLINATKQSNQHGLILSQKAPAQWPMALPDLKSRLKAAPLLEVLEPDDMLLRQVMVKLFADRQVMVEGDVIEYLVQRMERSLSFAQKLVNHLDKEALAEGRKITKPMASSSLKLLQDEQYLRDQASLL